MTQRRVWTHKLPGEFSASPVFAGDKIFIPNEDGLTYVFKTGQSYEQIAANHLHDGGFATPAICAGRIYLRTMHFLYCLGNAKEGAR